MLRPLKCGALDVRIFFVNYIGGVELLHVNGVGRSVAYIWRSEFPITDIALEAWP
jgi:hypothetical protein